MHRINKIIARLIGTLLVVALAVFMVTSNARLALNSLPLYEYSFHRHNVDVTTGLSLAQLSEAGQQIRDYFNSSEQLLDVRVTIDNTTRDLFVEREVLHMRDVKELISKVYRLQEGALIYLFLFLTIGFFTLRSSFGGWVRRVFVTGSEVVLVVVVVVALGSLVAFGPLFLLFHFASFSNDLWQLDPYTSNLLRMFPQGFWRDATLLIAAATVAESLCIMSLLTILGSWHRWRLRVAKSKAPQFG